MADSDAIAARRDAFLTAFNDTDVPALSEFLCPDHIGMPPNQPPLVGLAASHDFWRQNFAQASSVFTATAQGLDIDGDLAIDRFSWSMDVTPHAGA